MFFSQVTLCEIGPNRAVMEKTVGNHNEKPSLDEVLKYADKQADKHIHKLARHLPPELKDEIRQAALMKVWKAYDKIDPDRGWKSYVQTHSKGAVKDYLRDGKGFKETKWDSKAPAPEVESAEPEVDDMDADSGIALDAQDGDESGDAAFTAPEPKKFNQRLCHRMNVVNSEDGHVLDAEEVAGIFGVHSGSSTEPTIKINWDLVARLAAVDREVHLVAKIIRGMTETELAPGFGVTREMLSQRFYAFIAKLDSPEYYHSQWMAQVIYALGLCEHYGMPDLDNGLGWSNEPVDLDSKDSLSLMSLFQQHEFGF